MMQSRAAAPDDEPKSVDQNERLKSRLEAERKSTLVRPQSGEPGARAEIAPRPSNAGEPGAANRSVGSAVGTDGGFGWREGHG